MSMLDKIMFWKKEPKLDLDTSLDMGPDPNYGAPPQQGTEMNLGLDSQNLGMPSTPPGPDMQMPNMHMPAEQPRVVHDPVQSAPQQLQSESHEKNLEIISMKLDNLKVAIENINQRLINIERLAIDSTHQPQPKRPQW